MYFVDALRVLLRRWRIIFVGVLVLVAAAGAVERWVPTQYQASGQLLLLLPADATGPKTPTNPYLNLEPGLTTTASLIAGSMTTKDSHRALKAAGFTSEFSVALNPGTGPLLVITTKDTNAAEAVQTRDQVMRRLNTNLNTIQVAVDVPERQLIRSRPTSVDERAEVLHGSKLRALAGVGGADVLLTLIAAFVWDRFLRRRRLATAQSKGAAGTPGPGRSSNRPADGAARPAGANLTAAKSSSDKLRGDARRTGT